MIPDIIVNRPYGTGHRKIRQRFTDAIGNVSTINYIVAETDDLDLISTSHQTNFDNSLVVKEQKEFIDSLEAGINPFDTAPLYNDVNALRAITLKHFLSLPDATGLIKTVDILDVVTDAQLKALLTIDDAKVTEIRSKAADVKAIRDGVNNYIAPLEAE